ncbi:RagB/SusD family nutrient uptake outer membrane protein [Carboxylicivirga mesophila]|uniref:RagB/SusD family nutrient uptake outer membrane protein n=1 Tax=Carboxylicivirga mesophila TaxID=1166478 RepID=A0ABS5KHL4_9BACT|nr:RagB/SusD family nutrient uptake outer membrane protein [Carboxylicivirga mesophila]MBS2213818.1 RagB/SusD family nutrient uptake outer membrane protein [Carboxylicivirga mesophila]
MKAFKLINIVLIALLFSACSDLFDVVPQDTLDPSKIDKTKLQQLRNGIYQYIPGGTGAANRDGFVDNGYSRNPWDSHGGIIQKGTINAATNVAYDYSGIRVCNTFIDLTSKMDIDDETAKLVEVYTAESRVMRAWLHANITLFYGDAVIVEELTNDYGQEGVARVGQDEVRKWILRELDEAIAILPVSNDPARFNKAIATAIKARLAYFFGEYKQAEDAARYVIDKGGYALLSGVTSNTGMEEDNEFFSQLVDYSTLGIDKAAFEQGIQNYYSIWHTDGAANTEAIMFKEYEPNEQYGDWTRFASFLPPPLTNYQGWATIVPIQPLVDAYWMTDGTEFSPVDYATINQQFQVLEQKMLDIVNQDGVSEVEAIRQLYASGDLTSDDFMTQFRNRDARLYASIMFPFSSVRAFQEDLFYSYKSTIRNHGESGYTFRKMAASERYDDFGSAWGGGYGVSGVDFPIMRLAEMLLIYAEAHTQTTGYDATVETELNKLRDRLGMPHVPSGLGKTEAIEFIRSERRIEMAGEGLRYFDIRMYEDATRNGGVKGKHAASVVMSDKAYTDISGRVNSVELTWAQRLMLMPIPTTAMDRNSQLKQNDGY